MSSASTPSSLTPPRRLRCGCGATVHEGARFCWMCGAPVSPESTESDVINEENTGETLASGELQLMAWLALPVSIAIVFGVYLIEPGYAVLVGPALLLGTLAALVHGTLMQKATGAKTTGQRGTVIGTSVAVGAVTFAGTFAVTMLILIVIVAVMIFTLCAGLMELCGIQ